MLWRRIRSYRVPHATIEMFARTVHELGQKQGRDDVIREVEAMEAEQAEHAKLVEGL